MSRLREPKIGLGAVRNTYYSPNLCFSMEEVSIEVSDKEMAREVAIAIIGRAQDLNESPGEESQEAAEELRDVGQDLYKEYDAQL